MLKFINSLNKKVETSIIIKIFIFIILKRVIGVEISRGITRLFKIYSNIVRIVL